MGKKYDDLTDKQQEIIDVAAKNSDLTNKEIADKTDSSSSYVSQVKNDHKRALKSRKAKRYDPLVILLILLGIGLTVAYNSGMLDGII